MPATDHVPTEPASIEAAPIEAAAAPAMSRRGYQLAVLVLIGSLTLVALYARTAGERERQLEEAQFIAEAGQISGELRQQLLTYELTARGGVSLFATVNRPTAKQWRDYVDGLDLAQRFPAMVGLGFAEYLTPSALQTLQLETRSAGGGLFRITPPGLRPRYGPIVYLEPRTPENIAALGFDMYADPVRRAAMAAARDEGATRITDGVHLIQDADRPRAVGVLIYAPVYRAGFLPVGRSARDAALVGWVYAPFRMRPLATGALASVHSRLSLRIVDVSDGGERVLYPVAGDGARYDAAGPGMRHSIEEAVHGRRWRLDFHAPPAAGAMAGLSGAQSTIAVGLLASLLLFAMALSLARTQSQAQRIAERMSESYRRSELRFRNAMRFSAIGKALLDRSGTVVDANPRSPTSCGSSPEELTGTVFWRHFVDGHEDLGKDGELRVASAGVYRAMRELRRNDGNLRFVQLTYAPVPGDIGHDVASLVQVEDVTDRLRAEEDIRALNRTLEARVALRTHELTRANEELETFAYSVSHDLRAPLRAIDGFSRLLAERYSDAIDGDGRDYLARVRAATARMGELIDALLKMSRLSRGEMNRTSLDLSRMAAEIIAELRQPSRSARSRS